MITRSLFWQRILRVLSGVLLTIAYLAKWNCQQTPDNLTACGDGRRRVRLKIWPVKNQRDENITMATKIDLQHIKRMGIEREDENLSFRAFLKSHDLPSTEIDAIVHEITEEVVSQIDCTKCANCCKQIRPVLDKDDVSRFALGVNIPVSE